MRALCTSGMEVAYLSMPLDRTAYQQNIVIYRATSGISDLHVELTLDQGTGVRPVDQMNLDTEPYSQQVFEAVSEHTHYLASPSEYALCRVVGL